MKKRVPLYQLVAYGPMKLLGSGNKIVSREVYLSRPEAMGERQAFMRLVTAPLSEWDMSFLDGGKEVDVRVVELFLSYESEEGDVFHAGWEDLPGG